MLHLGEPVGHLAEPLAQVAELARRVRRHRDAVVAGGDLVGGVARAASTGRTIRRERYQASSAGDEEAEHAGDREPPIRSTRRAG